MFPLPRSPAFAMFGDASRFGDAALGARDDGAYVVDRAALEGEQQAARLLQLRAASSRRS
jgi:hypothetical protein